MTNINSTTDRIDKSSQHKDFFSTLDMVQESLFDPQKTSTNDDILKLMFSKNYVFGINKKRISVIRRVYGCSKLTIKVAKGEFNAGGHDIAISSEIEEIITAVIDGTIHVNSDKKNSLFQKNEARNSGADGEAEEPYYRSNDYKSDDSCQLTETFNKILIVPMRLYQDKSIGAFLIEGRKEDSQFEEFFSKDIDSLSNRVALFMSESDNQHRRKIQYALNSALTQNESPSRKATIECCVQHLTLELHAYYQEWAKKERSNKSKNKRNIGDSGEIENISQNLFPLKTQPWFEKDELDIIVRSPHYFDKFFWVYGEGNVKVSEVEDDQGESIDLRALEELAGNQLNESGYGYEMPSSLIEVFNSKRPLILNTSEDCAKYFGVQNTKNKKKAIPRSCAIFPMKIPGGGVIGYFIFKNYYEKRAYKAEEVLLDDISNKVAELFVKIRHQERDKKLAEFREVFHKKSQAYKGHEFYTDKLTNILKGTYGNNIKYCLILRNKLTGDIPDFGLVSKELHISESFARELNDESTKRCVADLAREFIMSRDNDNACYAKDFVDSLSNLSDLGVNNKVKNNLHRQLKRSAIFPLHRVPGDALGFLIEESPKDIKENVNVGCLIVKDAHLGRSDLKFLDSLTDQLALKFKLLDDQERKNQLYAFSKEIRETDDLNLEVLLGLIRKYTKKVMYTDNMFVALLDKDTVNEKGYYSIKFPLFYENGVSRPDTAKKVEKDRFFDLKSREKGRVEAILESGKAIYIDNLETSKAWYDPEDREERAGNYFYSFIGAPIWRKEEVVGVIAAYHPDKEYVYGKADLNFLVDLADMGSSLLRELRNELLETANAKIKRQQQALFNFETKNENRITKSSIIKNSVRYFNEISMYFDAINYDISAAIRTEAIGPLTETKAVTSEAQKLLNQFQNSLNEFDSTAYGKQTIKELISSAIEDYLFDQSKINSEIGKLESFNNNYISGGDYSELKIPKNNISDNQLYFSISYVIESIGKLKYFSPKIFSYEIKSSIKKIDISLIIQLENPSCLLSQLEEDSFFIKAQRTIEANVGNSIEASVRQDDLLIKISLAQEEDIHHLIFIDFPRGDIKARRLIQIVEDINDSIKIENSEYLDHLLDEPKNILVFSDLHPRAKESLDCKSKRLIISDMGRDELNHNGVYFLPVSYIISNKSLEIESAINYLKDH